MKVSMLAPVARAKSLPRTIAPEYSEPGSHRVELLDAGSEHNLAVARALRTTSQRTLPEVLDLLLEPLPSTVATDLSAASARAVADLIDKAGGKSRVVDGATNV